MPERLSLVGGVALWAATFVICCLLDLLVHGTIWSIVLYVGGGVFLSRTVIRRMIVGRPDLVATSGCAALAIVPIFRLIITLLWPITYPVIFLMLAIGQLLA